VKAVVLEKCPTLKERRLATSLMLVDLCLIATRHTILGLCGSGETRNKTSTGKEDRISKTGCCSHQGIRARMVKDFDCAVKHVSSPVAQLV